MGVKVLLFKITLSSWNMQLDWESPGETKAELKVDLEIYQYLCPYVFFNHLSSVLCCAGLYLRVNPKAYCEMELKDKCIWCKESLKTMYSFFFLLILVLHELLKDPPFLYACWSCSFSKVAKDRLSMRKVSPIIRKVTASEPYSHWDWELRFFRKCHWNMETLVWSVGCRHWVTDDTTNSKSGSAGVWSCCPVFLIAGFSVSAVGTVRYTSLAHLLRWIQFL